MSNRTEDARGIVDDAVLTAAGVADLAFSTLRRVVRPVENVVRRSDLRELTRDGRGDLKARGALALDRRLPRTEPPALEALAQRAKAARPPSGDA